MRSTRLGALPLALLAAACADPRGADPLRGAVGFDSSPHSLGRFRVGFEGADWSDARLVVRHEASEGRTLLETLPGRAFVTGGRGRAQTRESRGAITLSDETLLRCGAQTVESIVAGSDAFVLAGSLECPESPARWSVRAEAIDEVQLRLEIALDDVRLNRAGLVFGSDPDERFFGFGEQFGAFDLKGRRVPILVGEEGIGRGRQPLTRLMNLLAGSGVGGAWHTTPAPVPHFVTTRLRSLCLENAQASHFDLRAPDRASIEVLAPALVARIHQGETPLELIAAHTRHAGRMRALPAWALRGAIVAVQGGPQRVAEALQQLRVQETPLGAIWIQDWTGRRDGSGGPRTWWNWEVDETLYPDWDAMVAMLRRQDLRLLLGVNPYLVDASEKPGVRRNLFEEARAAGFLVRGTGGEPRLVPFADIGAALVDLTNDKARAWLARVMRDEMLARGASGWIADGGEALPWDARVASGERGADAHNRWPVEWARVNRDAIDARGRGAERLFLMRAGFTRSPGVATLFRTGDQLVSWDAHDGIKSAVVGILSGGISGLSLNHSDVGGATAIELPLVGVRRSRELLQRWAELAAFQVVFRSHEGTLPDSNHQWHGDLETLRHFTRMAKIWGAWDFYREELVREAARTGAPVLRHPFLHHPGEREAWAISHEEFLVGSELLVAPVLDPGRERVEVWFPPGRWVHVWSGEVHGADAIATRSSVPAPIGRPAVFHREGSAVGARLRERLAQIDANPHGGASRIAPVADPGGR